MLALTDIRDWLKNKLVGVEFTLAPISTDSPRCIGLYDGKESVAERVCLGGLAQTHYQHRKIVICAHWPGDPEEAQKKAAEVHKLFLELIKEPMGNERVVRSNPGGQPLIAPQAQNGECEYVINIELEYERMV